MANKSRADYFKKRRETIGQFNVNVPKEKLEALNIALEKRTDKNRVVEREN